MIEATRHDEILELRLDRPPVNALNPELIDVLTRTLEEAFADPGVGAVVLSGQPGMFSAGLDVPALLQLDEAGITRFWRRFFALLGTIAGAPVPVAAALTGHSPAGGAVLALFCDWRVMAEGDFRIGLNEVQVGLVVPEVIQRACRRLLGPVPAERLMVSGALLDPERAEDLGLVDRRVAEDAVVESAIGWCRGLLELPRQAMLQTRELARADLAALFRDQTLLDTGAFVEHWFREDTQQALQALVARLGKK